MPTDMKYYQEFGGEKVVFEKEEVAEMKKFADPGRLTLLRKELVLFQLTIAITKYPFMVRVKKMTPTL